MNEAERTFLEGNAEQDTEEEDLPIEILRILKTKPDVHLFLNDEVGVVQYSVTIEGNIWLDSFDTEAKARKFCEDHGLKCAEEICVCLNTENEEEYQRSIQDED